MKKNIELPELLRGASTPAQWKKRRAEIKELLLKYEYGRELPKPKKTEFIETARDEKYCASKDTIILGKIRTEINGGAFEFPVSISAPNDGKKHPAIICINFRAEFPDKYLPVEELNDRGFVVLNLFYKDVTGDNNDFSDPLCTLLGINRAEADAPGKIMVWAWAAMRAADCLLKMKFTDPEKLIVAGHSRLGKTALVTGALDERFAVAYSNDSGCSGASICRQTGGETIRNITEVFPFWFCPEYANWKDREEELPFDQHFLLALMAPRRVYVASAKLDSWACPENEFLSCRAASPAWEKIYGLPGVDNRTPRTGSSLHGGYVGYHLRAGTHYLGREDWNRLADYIERQFR